MSDRILFDALMELPSNRFALGAARAVAHGPGAYYNPLWIYGPSGTGKTALLDALDDALRIGRPRLVPLRMQMEHFVEEMVTAISGGTSDRFRSHCVCADAILLDHADCLYGKPITQQEIGLLLAEAVRREHQVILVSTCPPDALGRLREVLTQQCEFFLQADIQCPDPMERIDFARGLARQADLALSDAAFIRIAASTRNLSQVRCAVTYIAARRQLLNQGEAEMMKALEQLLPRWVAA